MRVGQGLGRGDLAPGEPLKNFKQKRGLIMFVKNYFGQSKEGQGLRRCRQRWGNRDICNSVNNKNEEKDIVYSMMEGLE